MLTFYATSVLCQPEDTIISYCYVGRGREGSVLCASGASVLTGKGSRFAAVRVNVRVQVKKSNDSE